MWADKAPGHVANILGLAKIGYYDGLTFHRIVKGFVIQGGCPVGNGTGGPGYTIKQEFNAEPHEPGVLSMARTSDPDSAGSQFFLCLERVPYLIVNTLPLEKQPTIRASVLSKKLAALRLAPEINPSSP